MTHKIIEWHFTPGSQPIIFSVMEWDSISKFEDPIRMALLQHLSNKYSNLSTDRIERLTEKSLKYYYENMFSDFSVNQFSDEQILEYLNLVLRQCSNIVSSMLQDSIDKLRRTLTEEKNVPNNFVQRGHLVLVG